MIHYEWVRSDLAQAEGTIQTALRSETDSGAEKTVWEEALELVRQAEKKCQKVQQESMQKLFSPVMKM